jgi:hypothetical protein
VPAAPAAPPRYVPARKDASRHTGVLLLRDLQWGQPDDQLTAIKAPTSGDDEGPEPPAPRAFEWDYSLPTSYY